MPTDNETRQEAQNGRNYQLLLLALGLVGNLLLGALTVFTTRLQNDIDEIEAIARTGAANATLIARDVDHLTRWTTDEIRQLKERLKRIDDQPYRR